MTCGTAFQALLGAGVLLGATGSATSSPDAGPPAGTRDAGVDGRAAEVKAPVVAGPTAQQVARAWFDAVKREDTVALSRASGFPLTIVGFQVESGPGRQGCGGAARADGLKGVREFHSDRTLEVVVHGPEEMTPPRLRCFLEDTFLRNYIPTPTRDGSWPTDPKSGESTGRIRVVKPGALSKHLRRYRTQAKRLARDHVLVDVVMTDNNGVTNSVLLALRPHETAGLAVDGAYIDELFEE